MFYSFRRWIWWKDVWGNLSQKQVALPDTQATKDPYSGEWKCEKVGGSSQEPDFGWDPQTPSPGIAFQNYLDVADIV